MTGGGPASGRGTDADGVLDVERSGGVGGLKLHGRVGLAELSAAERQALDAALATPAAPPSGPDRFVYRLRAGGREATLQETDVPPILEPLLRRLAVRR